MYMHVINTFCTSAASVMLVNLASNLSMVLQSCKGTGFFPPSTSAWIRLTCTPLLAALISCVAYSVPAISGGPRKARLPVTGRAVPMLKVRSVAGPVEVDAYSGVYEAGRRLSIGGSTPAAARR